LPFAFCLTSWRSLLQVDSRKIRETLNWKPPYTVDEGLKVTADWFNKTIK
jgi:nucleoside-diphosphate-sugar epimerase